MATAMLNNTDQPRGEEGMDWIRSKKLCAECEAIFQNWNCRDDWKKKGPVLKHHSIAALSASAAGGCPICELFLDSWTPTEVSKIHSLNPDAGSAVELLKGIRENPDEIDVRLNLDLPDVPPARMWVHKAENDDIEVISPVLLGTNHPELWTLAKKWLRACKDSHPGCSQLIMPKRLPTRLLKVGSTDNEICLCLSKNLPASTEYLTLSHCWGTNKFLTLTTKNIDLFMLSIKQSSLPKRFQQVMKATRYMGFQYIWIDSLCIMQDSELDWRYESESMGSVYANSSLNLMACDSADGDVGIFSEMMERTVCGWKVKASNDIIGSSETISRSATPGLEDSSSSSMGILDPSVEGVWDCLPFTSPYDRGALHTRAWVFQETHLSPRALQITEKEVSWECREFRASETFPTGLKNISLGIAAAVLRWYTSPQPDPLYQWAINFVTAYSKGRLTFETDKLVAISGLAKLYALREKSRYVAGLWEDNLLPQLTWTRNSSHAAPRPASYIAPTWSWASITEDVIVLAMLELKDRKPWAVAVDVSTQPIADPFGAVSGGVLTLRFADFNCGKISATGQQTQATIEEFLKTSLVYLDIPVDLDNTQFYFLPLMEAQMWELGLGLRGLILERDTSSPFTYRRCGLFILLGRYRIHMFTTLSRACLWKEEGLVRDEGVDHDGSPQYSVSII